jgi:hypothetical protein
MTATIVLFPTAGVPQAGDIAKTKEGNLYLLSKYHTTINPKDLTRMEMHIVSGDSIRKDDYYYHADSVMKKTDGYQNSNGRKIIYTSDKNLINDNVQPLTWEFAKMVIDDLNTSSLKILYYDTKLMNPMGRIINPLDLSKNTSQCRWVYSLSYGKPFSNDAILEKPITELLSEADFGVETPTQYTPKQVKVLLYRYIKEVSGKPIFDSDEQWVNENIK